MAKKELTLKQQAFIDEYLIDFKVKERDLYNDGERAETITTNRYRFGIKAGHWSTWGDVWRCIKSLVTRLAWAWESWLAS